MIARKKTRTHNFVYETTHRMRVSTCTTMVYANSDFGVFEI